MMLSRDRRVPFQKRLGATTALGAILAAMMVGSSIAAERAAEPTSRPNIVLIMADDMGFSDLGCYGSEIETPNIDRLAARGVRFTQFYNTSRCCSTRAALLTGLYSHQAGVGHMVEDRKLPGYRGFLNDRCVTIAEALGSAGYRTYLSGKWHVGERRPHWPFDRGFDRSYSLVSGGSNYYRLDPGRILARDDQQIDPPADWYITDAITDNAVQFVKEHDGDEQPFFMYVAYTAPHWPLHAPQETIAKYRDKYHGGWDELRRTRHQRMIEMGIVESSWPLTPRDSAVPTWEETKDKEEFALRMAVYAAQIDRMDQGIGQIVAQLKEQKLLDNTLILMLADNGGCAEIIERSVNPEAPTGTADTFRSYGIGWANASNTPFRRYKHWVHEGGISAPLIAHWPAKIKESAITHQPGHLIDIMATCVDVAGARYPTEFKGKAIQPMEGKSLRPILEGGKWAQERTLYWEHEGNRAVRQGKWKLVALHNKPWELYDLSADRTELNDLASAKPEKVAELTALWDTWAARANVAPWDEVPKPASAKGKGKGKGKGKAKGAVKAKQAKQ